MIAIESENRANTEPGMELTCSEKTFIVPVIRNQVRPNAIGTPIVC